jgi:hypothetical protein
MHLRDPARPAVLLLTLLLTLPVTLTALQPQQDSMRS